jgi:hypothetical protein
MTPGNAILLKVNVQGKLQNMLLGFFICELKNVSNRQNKQMILH